MAGRPARVALFVCTACRQPHAVRVDADPVRVACGALAAAEHNNGGVEAWVWEVSRPHVQRPAFLIDVQTVEPQAQRRGACTDVRTRASRAVLGWRCRGDTTSGS